LGRPVNKRFLGDAVDSIQVTSYFRVGGTEIVGGDDTYIVKQRSGSKFIVGDTSGGWEEALTLVDKAAGALLAGEFRIEATDTDGTPYQVTRLYNRTVRLGDNLKSAWSVTSSHEVAISNATQADPVVITADDHGLTTGDSVTIRNVVDMVELNNATYTVTVLTPSTFSLDDEDGTGYTSYASGGVFTVPGSGVSIDLQSA
jgi:hypothetical protein